VQINSSHLAELSRFGIGVQDLVDPRRNIFVGTWHYSKMIRKYGSTWQAVGAYHSEMPELRNRHAFDVNRIWTKYGPDL
jgi:soluble lytic murein transglycosylase-like protein